jgi:hypothetical protein
MVQRWICELYQREEFQHKTHGVETHRAISTSGFPPLPLPYPPLFSLPSRQGSGGITPGKFFPISDGRR